MDPILEVRNLTKIFRAGGTEFSAVDNISFSVKEGEIVGLLGPNGAGKTTTIQMLLGLITPTSGTISYFGKHFPQEREYILTRINFASAYNHLQGRMTVMQNLIIYSGLYGMHNPEGRIKELLDLLGIAAEAHTTFWKLSSGQKTRAILAKALLNKPQLLLMDEPTASLDPEIANKVVELVRDLQKHEKVSILYTSHNMKEVAELCDRVMFLNHGKIVVEDTPLGLTKRIGDALLVLTFDSPHEKLTEYLEKENYHHVFPRKQVIHITTPEKDVPKILYDLQKRKIWITTIDVEKPDMEDVFLSIAKGSYL